MIAYGFKKRILMINNMKLFLAILILSIKVNGQCPLIINYDAAGNRVYRGNDCDPDCSTLVTTTADDGVGSLRRAIACAADGDTITFVPSLIGQYIDLTTGYIPVNKSIHIVQGSSTVIRVRANLSGPVMDLVSGDTELKYMKLYASSEAGKQGRGLINRDSLTLDNVEIYDSDILQGNGSTMVNYGNVLIKGQTKIIILPAQ